MHAVTSGLDMSWEPCIRALFFAYFARIAALVWLKSLMYSLQNLICLSDILEAGCVLLIGFILHRRDNKLHYDIFYNSNAIIE